MAFEPEMPESQSETLKTRIITQFQIKTWVKNWLLALACRAQWPGQKSTNLLPLWCHPQKTQNLKHSNFKKSNLEDLPHLLTVCTAL